ncbi:hypothetical protein [Mycolicibacterium mengxianglii]|uniref:hypothetical protein n=1 Tax=Mycolicibacterium mengxianglii TaxID=2736649 RepID=UPI0018EEDC99|nr:hypothetical protein [Mycolicibacterium mengxianglii]
MTAQKQSSRIPSIAGLGLAATGVSHFLRPQVFESFTAPAFPRNTRKHIYANGSFETAIGLAMVSPKTRKFAAIGGLAYVVYVGANAARNR